MAPATNDTMEKLYVSHTVVKSDVPIALFLSILFAMIFFFALYIFCCLAAMKGKLDIVLDRKTKHSNTNLKFVNPLKSKVIDDDAEIPLYDDLNSAKESQTDSDTC